MQNVLKTIWELDDQRSEKWNEYWELHEKFDKIKDETFKSLVEEFEKHNKITSKYNKLKDIDELAWYLYEAALDGVNLWVEDSQLFTLNTKLCSTAHVTRTKGAKIASTYECSLCLETHDLKHLVKTSCRHYFGKKCFAALLKNNFYVENQKIRCPNCRNDDITLQQFKYKK